MGQLPGDFCLKFTAPVRDCSSYRGNLLSTVQPVGKQGHHDAGHDLRGCVQQELLHVDNLLYRRAVPGAFLARRAGPGKGERLGERAIIPRGDLVSVLAKCPTYILRKILKIFDAKIIPRGPEYSGPLHGPS